MKKAKLILLLVLIASSNCFAQLWDTRFCDDCLKNKNIDLLMHKDSIKNLYLVDDSGIVVRKTDTINLFDSLYSDYLYNVFQEAGLIYPNVKSYLLYDSCIYKGLWFILSFYKDRLIEINLYSTNYYYSHVLRNITLGYKSNSRVGGYSGKWDSLSHSPWMVYGYKIQSYYFRGSTRKVYCSYYENISTCTGNLMFENEKLLSKMPHWCGTCNGNRTWEVYEKYLNKLVRKKYGKEKKVVSNLPVNTPIAAPEINW